MANEGMTELLDQLTNEATRLRKAIASSNDVPLVVTSRTALAIEAATGKLSKAADQLGKAKAKTK